LQELRTEHPEIVDLHFFSDGPTTQYRNKLNFWLLSTLIYDMGFHSASWNFFESGHGKGAPDAIGGSVKRQADALVLTGLDIPDAKKLFTLLDCANSAVKFYFVTDSDILAIDNRCEKNLKAIPGTMKVHQLVTDEKQTVSYRDLSCFCQRPNTCTCYNLHYVRFHPIKSSTVSMFTIALVFDKINYFCNNECIATVK
jgi:hypothetical protein